VNDLRQVLAESLRTFLAGEESAGWKVSGNSLQLIGDGEQPMLQCCIRFEQRFADDIVRSMLEYAQVSFMHFDASVTIDRDKGQLFLIEPLARVTPEGLWQACERMANQAEVWTDMVCRKLFSGARSLPRRAPSSALAAARF
jgi:hypothetical protein